MTRTLNTWFTVNPILKTWKCWSWNCQDVSHPVMPIFLHTMFLLLVWRILLTTSFNETISELFFVQKPSQVPSVKYYDRTVTNHPLKFIVWQRKHVCVCVVILLILRLQFPQSLSIKKNARVTLLVLTSWSPLLTHALNPALCFCPVVRCTLMGPA